MLRWPSLHSRRLNWTLNNVPSRPARRAQTLERWLAITRLESGARTVDCHIEHAIVRTQLGVRQGFLHVMRSGKPRQSLLYESLRHHSCPRIQGQPAHCWRPCDGAFPISIWNYAKTPSKDPTRMSDAHCLLTAIPIRISSKRRLRRPNDPGDWLRQPIGEERALAGFSTVPVLRQMRRRLVRTVSPATFETRTTTQCQIGFCSARPRQSISHQARQMRGPALWVDDRECRCDECDSR